MLLPRKLRLFFQISDSSSHEQSVTVDVPRSGFDLSGSYLEYRTESQPKAPFRVLTQQGGTNDRGIKRFHADIITGGIKYESSAFAIHQQDVRLSARSRDNGLR